MQLRRTLVLRSRPHSLVASNHSRRRMRRSYRRARSSASSWLLSLCSPCRRCVGCSSTCFCSEVVAVAAATAEVETGVAVALGEAAEASADLEEEVQVEAVRAEAGSLLGCWNPKFAHRTRKHGAPSRQVNAGSPSIAFRVGSRLVRKPTPFDSLRSLRAGSNV